MKLFSICLLLCYFLCSCESGFRSGFGNFSNSPKYRNIVFQEKFSEVQTKKGLPLSFLSMHGSYRVVKLGLDYAMHLSPRANQQCKLLFGPEQDDSLLVSADIFAGQLKDVIPLFGIGSHGINGHKLVISQTGEGEAALALYRGDHVILGSTPIKWQSDSWTSFKLKIVRQDNALLVLAKAWKRDTSEPAWMIKKQSKNFNLTKGRCSLLATPYSGRDTFFDNLSISTPAK
ncbi:MAG: hypothetical protein HRT88_24095 [Lentisphaeraceae bacterium]|nr:hypothetical protein [Lentisphaeraceae bacterium]